MPTYESPQVVQPASLTNQSPKVTAILLVAAQQSGVVSSSNPTTGQLWPRGVSS